MDVAEDTPPELSELRLKRTLRAPVVSDLLGILFFLTLLVGGAISLSVEGALGETGGGPWRVFGIVLAFEALLYAWYWFREGRRLDVVHSFLTLDPQPLSDRVGQVLTTASGWWAERIFRACARAAAREGYYGQTLRVAPNDDSPPIVPLVVPIEPSTLLHVDDLYWERRGEVDGVPEWTNDWRVSTWRKVRRAPRGMARSLLISLRTAGAYTTSCAVFILLNPPLWMRSVEFPLIFGYPVAILVWCVLHMYGIIPGDEWLACNGGLIRRRTSLFSSTAQVRLFDRRYCVAIAYPRRDGLWALAISSRRELVEIVRPREEITAALRAWLSALHPPHPLALADLE